MKLFELIFDILKQIFSGPTRPEPIPDRIKRDLDPVIPDKLTKDKK